jgi:osmotically-inducible protein OsmY
MISIDEQIKQDVVSQLLWDGRVDASKIKIEVSQGIVKLEGFVPSAMARSAAVEDAEVVRGVMDVINALNVRIPDFIQLPADADLKISIGNMLAANPDIDPSRITVMVQEGRVTLKGSVDGHWKKGFVETVVALQCGVTDVESSLTVVPTKAAADQATAEDIVAALKRHALMVENADDITVSVEEGSVTLSGTVPNASARKVAGIIASYTYGVTDVTNELEVVAP